MDWEAYDKCPVCKEKSVTTCRCPKADKTCPNGHHWHLCLAHGDPKLVIGESDHSKDTMACSCIKEDDEITPGERFIYEWQYGQLSHFKEALVELLMRADADNLEKMKKAFPDETEAFINYRNIPDWWPSVTEKLIKVGLIQPAQAD